MTGEEFFARLRAWRFGHAQAALSSLGTLVRSPLGTLLTCAVIGVALALPAAAWIVVNNLLEVSTHFGSEVDISVFLDPSVTDERGARMAEEIAALESVERVRMISKSQALEEFRASAQAGYGLEGLGEENPLPVVVVVTPHDPGGSAVTELVARLQTFPAVDFVQDDRDWLARLDAVAQLARRVLWLVSGVLSLGIILVVGNTVRLSMESRRAEVEIAKLFGASDAFVRRPFLYHGLYYGLAGAVVAWLLLTVAGLVLGPALERLGTLYPGWASLRGVGGTDLLGLLLAGGALGLMGAWLWVGQNLRRVEPR